MNNPKATFHDASTSRTIERELTDEEYAQLIADQETAANLPDTQVLPNAQ